MYCGFKGLCGTFTEQCGQHYVVPVRINGSAIESLLNMMLGVIFLPQTMSLPFHDFLLLMPFQKAKRKSRPIARTNLV